MRARTLPSDAMARYAPCRNPERCSFDSFSPSSARSLSWLIVCNPASPYFSVSLILISTVTGSKSWSSANAAYMTLTRFDALVNAFEHIGDVLEVRRIAAARQKNRLPFRAAHARMIQIDMDHRLLAHRAAFLSLLESDQERAARDDARKIFGVPAPALEEQVFDLP